MRHDSNHHFPEFLMKNTAPAFILLLAVLFLAFLPTTARASDNVRGDFGFGLQAGDPAGFTIKYWTSHRTAIDGYFGWSFFGSPRLGVDWLWHYPVRHATVAHFYAGIGGTLGLGNGRGIIRTYDNGAFYYRSSGTGLGVRGVGGLSVEPRTVPLEFFFDLGLLVGVTPNFGSALEAAIGLRFYP